MNSDQLRVRIAELRAAVDAALGQLEADAGECLEFTEDDFWAVSPDDLFDPTRDPALTIGQLSEDLGWIRSSMREPSPIRYNLVWIANVFRAIGMDRFTPVRSDAGASQGSASKEAATSREP